MVDESCHGLVIPSPSSFGLQNLPFPITVLPHSSCTPLCLQGTVSSGRSKKQQVVLMCWKRPLGPSQTLVIQVAGAGRQKNWAWKWDEGCGEAIRTGSGLYGIGMAASSCVYLSLCTTWCQGKESQLFGNWEWLWSGAGHCGTEGRALLGAGGGAWHNKAKVAMSCPFLPQLLLGNLAIAADLFSNQDLWLSWDLLLLCPKLILIWLRKCHDQVFLTSVFG